MAQAVSCQPVPEEAWFNPKSFITAFIVDIVALEQVFCACTFFVHMSVIPPMLHNLAFIYYNATQS
jgi:hypothetical protein